MYLKKINYLIILSLFVAFLTNGKSFADMASGSMPAPMFINASQVASYYKGLQKKRKLTRDEIDRVNLLSIATGIFGIKEFETSSYQESLAEKARALQLFTIALSIEQELKKKSNWDNSVSKKQWEQITQSENLLKSNLGPNSYTSAWINYQHGNKKEAKAILTKGFEDLFTETMKLKELNSFNNSNPMTNSEYFSKALTQMSTDEENKAREIKLKEMRLHVSSLPDLMIMT